MKRLKMNKIEKSLQQRAERGETQFNSCNIHASEITYVSAKVENPRKLKFTHYFAEEAEYKPNPRP
jgi:hypothetical protein